MLEKFRKKVPAKTQMEKRFNPKTGEQAKDELVMIEDAHEVVEILGKKFKLDTEECFSYEKVLFTIAGEVGARYIRTGSSRQINNHVFLAFLLDNEDLSWIMKHTERKCEMIIGELAKLGLKVGKPKLIHGVNEV